MLSTWYVSWLTLIYIHIIIFICLHISYTFIVIHILNIFILFGLEKWGNILYILCIYSLLPTIAYCENIKLKIFGIQFTKSWLQTFPDLSESLRGIYNYSLQALILVLWVWNGWTYYLNIKRNNCVIITTSCNLLL